MINYVKTRSGVQAYDSKGTVYLVDEDHPFYTAILAILADTAKTFEDDFLPLYESKKEETILTVALGENFTIDIDEEGSQVFKYKGLVLPKTLTRRMLKALGKMTTAEVGIKDWSENNIPVAALPLISFAENLLLNPSHSSVNELFSFLEVSNLPMTQDGCFLAYKKVGYDYKDLHSHSFDNSIGKVLEMKRWEVDDNRQNTCSNGFHCCSFDYLSHYGGTSKDTHRIMIVKVNPKNVVAVPSDYKNQKMRVCEYEVVGELPNASSAKLAKWFQSPALEGKVGTLLEEILTTLVDVSTKYKLSTMWQVAKEEGINFNEPFIGTIASIKEAFTRIESVVDAMGIDAAGVDFDDFDGFYEYVTVNNILEFINERV